MRIAQVIFVGLAAALFMTAPVLAKKTQSQKTDDQSTSSSSCHAYQQAPDGSWEQLPCQEAGGGQTQQRPPPKSAEDAPR
jgi:hypothetical protein